MRLPWEKLLMEVIEVSAPELGAKLYPELDPELAEAAAGWGIVHVVKWALARCPDHQPPSANAVVPGLTAALQIARAARYKGDPAEYARVASSMNYPTLEVLPDGIRIRGLDRYDSAWGENHKAEWKAWKAAHPERYPPDPQGKSAGTPPENRGPDPDPDPDAEKKTPPPPSPRSGPKLVVVGKKVRVTDLKPAARVRWEQIQQGRRNAGLVAEADPPGGFPAWSDELDAKGVEPPRLEHALALYLRDQDFKPKLWPTAVFITPGVFGNRLPAAIGEVMW
ncbi:MAG: hypothetical protein AAB721_02975 [Patescibacteria group bacterium]